MKSEAEEVAETEELEPLHVRARNGLLERGYSLAGYARAKGFNIFTFRMWLRGEWGTTSRGGTTRNAYVKALQEDGIIR